MTLLSKRGAAISTSHIFVAIALAAGLGACGGATPAPVAAPVSAEPDAPEPARLPIGEITKEDVPALMDAIYTDGVPENVQDLGLVILGERVVLLTGADNPDACAECTGSLSLFYLVRMDAGFLLQEHYRDFQKSGSGGKFNREIEIVQFPGLEGRPSHLGFTDVNGQPGCDAKTLTVTLITEAGPRTALEAPFGAASVRARIIDAERYQAEFAIAYETARDDFVAPYMFINQALRQSFPTPEWTRTAC